MENFMHHSITASVRHSGAWGRATAMMLIELPCASQCKNIAVYGIAAIVR